MNLYKVADSPYWRADFSVRGKRYRISTKRTSKTEARRVAEAEYREVLAAVQNPDGLEMTLAEAIARDLADNKGAKGIHDRRSVARKLVAGPGYEDRFGLDPKMPLSELTTAKVSALASARRREGNKEATINKELALLQRIYNVARLDWGVNCRADVRFPKKKSKPKMRWLRHDEELALLLELYPWRERAGLPRRERRNRLGQQLLNDQYDLVVFLLDTGARYDEVASMTWEMVDTVNWKHILLTRSKVENASTIEMTVRLRTVLMWRWAERGNSRYIFPSRDDPSRKRGHATRGIVKAMERAGINTPDKIETLGKATVHSLRDTFATRLVMHDRPLYEVQVLLGHTSPQMTQKYAHLAPSHATQQATGLSPARHLAQGREGAERQDR
jgi:integrase